MDHRVRICVVAAWAAWAACGAVAAANVLTYQINTSFAGATSEGEAPFITIEFDDGAAEGDVRMTASAPGLSLTEFVSQVDFNLDPGLDANQLTFANFNVLSGVLLHPQVLLGNNGFEAGGGGSFDIQLNFAVSGGGFSRRFNAGESFSLDFGGIAGLTAESFHFASSGLAPQANQFVAVHIEGIGTDAADGWHTVPEPSVGAGMLLLLAWLGRRKVKANVLIRQLHRFPV